ncbi:alcaligin biosynthesis protein [Nocardioides mangrovicus]|uniref:L-lysine N6-monooxygenase MbtG n=1 Tax=Nocardioides mangrovicus TaxID=2478913 RepID=A0A3L8P536_9ACTN|nr:SidA/IucD/PvdA family monooxygenase [Nocardioides mangrovicus]RLV50291.1 alcaligin biosynthesis protein [Nocardioides mangrovicus]
MEVHDFVAVGLGPFNLGLACLTAPVAGLDGVFLEAEDDFSWHPGMLLPEATLQVPFLADLVTMADPTSPYSFLAYLKDRGRLYPFYIRESFYPLRSEYDDYCRWATRRLRSVEFDRRVEEVTHTGDHYVVHSRDPRTGAAYEHHARRLVVGTGTPAYVPPALAGLPGPAVHSGDYLHCRDGLRTCESITVVGSGQSAAEIFADLLDGIEDGGYALRWVTRSPRFFPLEYTKLTLEMTSPEYAGYFHGLPRERRDALLASQRQLYKGISGDLVDSIFDRLYATHLRAEVDTQLLTNVEVTDATWDGTRYRLALHHQETGDRGDLDTEGLVLATGYRPELPGFLEPVHDRIRWDDLGRPDVGEGYAIDHHQKEIYVQNGEVHSHGFTAPDLGMGAYRNSVIIRELTGEEVYPVERRIAFQEFGLPASTMAQARR